MPLSAWKNALNTRRCESNEYRRKCGPDGAVARTPTGAAWVNAPSAVPASSRYAGSPSTSVPRVSACIAVPCARPLIHGGRPPPKAEEKSPPGEPARGEGGEGGEAGGRA